MGRSMSTYPVERASMFSSMQFPYDLNVTIESDEWLCIIYEWIYHSTISSNLKSIKDEMEISNVQKLL